MVSTNKVLTLSAGIIATDCMLAGMAIAGLTGQGVGTMSETLAVALTLCVILAALNTILIRLHIKDWKAKHEKGKDPASDDLAEALESDLGADAAKQIMGAVLDLKEAIAPLLEDYHMRKAVEKADDLPTM